MKRQRIPSAILVFLVPLAAMAQQDRIAGRIDRQHMVTLKGNMSPKARPEFDRGALDPAQKLTLLTLMLRPSASQQKALDQVLTEQQDPLSANYHKWLTPEQYADRFGLSRADISKIESWLRSQGLSVDEVARGRNRIVFSGTVAQVETAFRTELHKYDVDGEKHFANYTEPSVPAALAPLVTGVQGLNDFRPKPPGHARGTHLQPRFTSSSSGANFLRPDDLATIYDVVPLYQAGYDGTGQKLVVAGQTKVNLTDISLFRSRYGLVGNQPQELLVPSSVDPGVTGDIVEADLDLEWSGAVARGAKIIYVYSSDVYASVQYAIDQNLAPVISFSYGLCELAWSGTDAQGAQGVAQQANAQGITWIVSSGDSGSAGCDLHGQNPLAQDGLATNIFSSIPEVTGVGGTQFNEGGGTYWNTTNSGSGESARGYIPEQAWNESDAGGLLSTGGGYSIFYPRPSWQSGPGVTNTNARATPDVSLSAAKHDGYLIFTGGSEFSIGGTSAATPSFAGMITILNQYQVVNGFQNTPGQGNLNPNLYRLAQSTSNIFHDIVSGDNIVPCSAGTPDCTTGSYGYRAGPGYDPVTGLGTVDANNLVSGWNSKFVSTNTSVTASPSTFTSNGSTKLTATVTVIGSAAVPTGTVAFNFGSVQIGSATLVKSGNAALATLTVYGGQLSSGSDTIQASYSGSSNFSPSNGTVTLTVSLPAGSSAVVPAIDPNPVFEEEPDADGYSWFYTLTLTEMAGSATTLTKFVIDGDDLSDEIADFFGSAEIPAFGTLSSAVRSRNLTVPDTRLFEFGGKDPGGHQWSQQSQAPFFGKQITAGMNFTSFPGTVRQDPSADSDCQWLQYLGLEERNGHSVRLTKFLAGGDFGTTDLSDQILEFFPSKTLPALGTLVGAICWSGLETLPQTKTYEIHGVDDTGTSVIATVDSVFDAPSTGGGLATSADELDLTVDASEQATSTTIDVNVSQNAQWTITVFPSNRKTRWLSVFPQSGIGPAEVTVIADSTGLAEGYYDQPALVFQSNDTQPQFIAVPVTFTVGTGALAKPVIDAVVNGASFKGGVLVPGEIVTLFGTNLTSKKGINITSSLPLPIDFLNTSVLVDDAPVPLFAVDNVNGQQQINFQIPWEVAGEAKATIAVSTNGVTSDPVSISVAAQPGIFDYSVGGKIFGAILHANFQLADTNHPVKAGETVLIYCTGLGPVKFPPGDGAPAAGQSTAALPSVTIGGKASHVSFSGLAPGFVGLNQINVVVPSGLASGNQAVVVKISGASSNSVLLPVK